MVTELRLENSSPDVRICYVELARTVEVPSEVQAETLAPVLASARFGVASSLQSDLSFTRVFLRVRCRWWSHCVVPAVDVLFQLHPCRLSSSLPCLPSCCSLLGEVDPDSTVPFLFL